MYIRTNRGTFDPEHSDTISMLLCTLEKQLAPAIKRCTGFLKYHTGIDVNNGVMIAVSFWDTKEHALAISQLAEMNAQRQTLQAQGVAFEPIHIYEILWQV